MNNKLIDRACHYLRDIVPAGFSSAIFFLKNYPFGVIPGAKPLVCCVLAAKKNMHGCKREGALPR